MKTKSCPTAEGRECRRKMDKQREEIEKVQCKTTKTTRTTDVPDKSQSANPPGSDCSKVPRSLSGGRGGRQAE